MDLKKKIGLGIQAARKSKNLTQAELAEKINLSKEYISNVENGKKGLNAFGLISDIARALDLGASELMLQSLLSMRTEKEVTPEMIPYLVDAWKNPDLRPQVIDIFDLLIQGPPEFRQGLQALVVLARKSSQK